MSTDFSDISDGLPYKTPHSENEGQETARSFTIRVLPSGEFVQIPGDWRTIFSNNTTGATIPRPALCDGSDCQGPSRELPLLKLERQEGAGIKFGGEEGKKVFDIDVLIVNN